MCIYIYMQSITINEKGCHKVEREQGGYIRVFGGRKGNVVIVV